MRNIKYRLKATNGMVKFMLRSGKDFVKNQMSESFARHIITTGIVKESCIEGYPINVDDKWYFEGIPYSKKKEDCNDSL